MKTKTKKTVTKKKTAPRTKRSAAPKSGMTGYLVVWRHTMDDVPVGLFSNRAEAFRVAKTMSHRAGRIIADSLYIDCDTPVCFTVVQFENGKPVDIVGVNRKDDF